jgi:hypothetical protein
MSRPPSDDHALSGFQPKRPALSPITIGRRADHRALRALVPAEQVGVHRLGLWRRKAGLFWTRPHTRRGRGIGARSFTWMTGKAAPTHHHLIGTAPGSGAASPASGAGDPARPALGHSPQIDGPASGPAKRGRAL